MRPFGVIVLAAGGSSRMGRPKQLLAYQGRTLVQHAVQTALDCGSIQTVVVVGSSAGEVREVLAEYPVQIIDNGEWEEGMGSSIRVGIDSLRPDIEACLISLCDQPLITAQHLKELVERLFASNRLIVATGYEDAVGVPCAFAKSIFLRLRTLDSRIGARDIVRSEADEVVRFNDGRVDIDTPDDYNRLI